MLSRSVAWLLCALLAFGSPHVQAISSEPAKEKLRSMAQAVRAMSYSGKLVYQRADVLVNLAFQHDVVNGKETARLRRLSGQALERAQSGSSLIEATPGPNVLRQGYPLPGMINSEPRQIFEAPYQIMLGGVERIADRSAQLVLVESMDGHRHSYKFWVDEETSLLLRSQTLNAESQTLEQFEFSELTVGPQSVEIAGGQESFQVKVYPITEPGAVLQFSPASWLPSGYQLVSALPSRAGSQRVYTLVYTDGLGSFSIFLELTSARPDADMQAILGPTVALGKDYALSGGALRVTLVGEIPPETGKTIIDALDVDGLKGLLSRSQ
ncbi:MAG: Sigma factor AlgU regulatory protein MucB [Gammaproteobacteria bacterium]|nr:MAG: Sigma factor AlgU regulatory protein MucB [Gammaproteobacteria bacterium]